MNPVIVRNVRIGEGIPKICVPIVGTTKEEILQTAAEILRVPADLVEWRADWFVEVDDIEKVKGVLSELRSTLGEIPLLFTFRTKTEGGARKLEAQRYAKLNVAVMETGYADLVDVEVFTAKEEVAKLVEAGQQHEVKIVGSNHDFSHTPEKEEIIRRLCYMQECGVDIVKIAVMPNSKEDVRTLLQATAEMLSEYADRPMITMSMSERGTVSRIAGELYGSAVTFGSLHESSAPGQIPVRELKYILEMLHDET